MSKAELIRAGVVHAPGTAPVMEDVELALPRDTEVLIRIESSGVCHTDVAYAAGEFFPEFPVVLGHEIAGIVEAIGARVDRVRLGDRVVFTVDRHCGVCRHCLAGHPVLCQSGIDVEQPPRLRLRGDAVVHGMGGFAEATELDDDSFDAILNAVSVQYLTRPVEVFRSAARVLRPGGVHIVAMSHRCFPTKAIRAFHALDGAGRCEVVEQYFALAGGYRDVGPLDRSPRGADPLWLVVARRA